MIDESQAPRPTDEDPSEQATVSAELVSPATEATGNDSPPTSATPPHPRVDKRYFLRLAFSAGAFLAVGLLLIVLLGVAQRMGWLAVADGGPAANGAAAAGTIYTCPMHPQIRQPNPGRCPICSMPLEPATTDGDSAQDEFSVSIEPAARRLANIRTVPVEQRPVARRLESVGRIAIDESRQSTIAAYVAGRIERLFADYTGVEVERGDHLAVIYSPPLYAAQVEYLESVRTLSGMDGAALAAVRRSQERLVAASRQRLTELGMTAEQLAELEQSQQPRSRMTIYAPIGGTVIQKPVVEGRYVEVGEPIYQIADLRTIWLLLQLYPEDASLIRFGQRVEVEVQSLPGRAFEGRVAFVNPVVDQRTRTVDVRIELLNEDRLLRPGDYARAEVLVPLGERGQVYDADLAGKWISPMHPQIIRDQEGECPICGMDLVPTSRYGYADHPVPQPEVLVVPRLAVLMTGSTSLIYVEKEPGRFEIRPVQLGSILRDEVVIVEGVAPGEQVAVSGNFLIDSQMQLAGKPSLIDPQRALDRPPPSTGPLSIPADEAEPLAGDAGELLERLYRAYFVLVERLAADRLPEESEVAVVERTARALSLAESLPQELQGYAEEVAEHTAHLHHRELPQAREQFKQISRNVLLLAAGARGAEARQGVVHYYCSMVEGGGGDWLQASGPPTNPYWGDRMLRCVQHERELTIQNH